MTQNLPTPTAVGSTATVAESLRPSHDASGVGGGGFFARVKRIFAFLGWILTGFGLAGFVIRRRQTGASRAEEIVVYTVHPSFYLWAIILVGFVSAACVKHWPLSATTWGWVYVFVLLYTIVTLLFDISTMKALLWGGIFLLLWIASKYLEDLKHITVLSGVW